MLKFKNISLIFILIIVTLATREIYSAVNDSEIDPYLLDNELKKPSAKYQEAPEGIREIYSAVNDSEIDPDLLDSELKKPSAKYQEASDMLLYMLPCVGYPAYQLINQFYQEFNLNLDYIIFYTLLALGGAEFADFLSGVQHAFLDNMNDKNPKYPEILRIASSFYKAHHYHPKQVTKASYWLLTRHLYQESLLVLPLLIYFNCYSTSPYNSILLNMAFLTFPQHQFIHACAHGKKISYSWIQKPIEWCQDHNILLSWNAHKAHHNGKYEENFCGITGHTNYLLNSLIKGIRYFSRTILGKIF